jgi:hypothetical protein
MTMKVSNSRMAFEGMVYPASEEGAVQESFESESASTDAYSQLKTSTGDVVRPRSSEFSVIRDVGFGLFVPTSFDIHCLPT